MQQLTSNVYKIYGEVFRNVVHQNFLHQVRIIRIIIQPISVKHHSIPVLSFVYQFRLNRVSPDLLSCAIVRQRGFSSVAVAKESLIQTGTVKKIEPTEQGPILLVNHESSAADTRQILPMKVCVDIFLFIQILNSIFEITDEQKFDFSWPSWSARKISKR